MRAKITGGKTKSEPTAGQSTSERRDVAQDTSSVEQETKKGNRAVASAPELSDDEESGSDFAPEELSQTPLERRKKQLIDSIMVIVMQFLDEKFPPKQHCRGDSSSVRSHGASTGGGRRTKETGRDGNDGKENAPPQRLGKRQQRDETPERNGDGDGGRGGKGSKRAKKEETGRKFACPFYKHAPSRYKNHRTCRFPGFSTLARLKEHIYRTHLNSLLCPRCGDKFRDDEARESHLRADDVCEKKSLPPVDGVTKAQEKKLRARPKRGDSEEEQWVSIYKIIFPDTPADSIPRPYCDDQEPQSLDGMHAFIRRQFPRVVRRKLEDAIERKINGIGAELKDKFIQIVPHLMESLIMAYRGDMEQSDDETLAPVTSAVAGANNQQPSQVADVSYNDPESYDSMLNLEDFPEFHGIFEDFDGSAGLGSTPATMPFFS